MSYIEEGPDGTPVAFADLPAHAFPVHITAFRGDDVVWDTTIEPYVATPIPALGEIGDVRIRVEYGNGQVVWR